MRCISQHYYALLPAATGPRRRVRAPPAATGPRRRVRAPPAAHAPGRLPGVRAAGGRAGHTRPSDFTASRSDMSSATEASIRLRENSLISAPWMISHSPFAERTGNELMSPSGTP
jgi:hypothetical protein